MHTTGIVRRIDELGRVVIPKEIRRTLRIREGEELEIFTDEENGLVLRKYSAVKSLVKFAEEYAEAINSTTNHTVLIADKDTYVYVAGPLGKELKNKQISYAVEQIIMNRKKELRNEGDYLKLTIDDNNQYQGQLLVPIISYGDVFGAIIVVSANSKISEADVKLLDTAKSFLERQI